MRTFDPDAIDCSDHDAVMDTFEAYEDDIDAIESHAQHAVQRAYLCEKPLTEVELGEQTTREIVDTFADKMSDWFYTYVNEIDTEINGEMTTIYSVYLTRFKGVMQVVQGFVDGKQRMPADLRGVMFGYETTDVAGFCEDSAPSQLK